MITARGWRRAWRGERLPPGISRLIFLGLAVALWCAIIAALMPVWR